jgi:hypothetical protein
MGKYEMIDKFLIEILEQYSEWRGNAGCNDWSVSDTTENRALINHIWLYGIAKNLWDAECGPSFQDGKIMWGDYAVPAYIQEALANGDLKLDMKVSV